MEPEDQEKEIEMEQEPLKIYQEGGAVNSVNGKTGDVVLTTSDLQNTSDYQNGTQVENAISAAVAGKQDTLTAGDNITIDNNTISATDTTYTAGNGLNLNGTEFSVNTNTIATQQDVTNEATARENADINLQGQIDAISAASDVTDVVGTYADLQAYDTQNLKDNDIIKVLQDESQNDETTYYRWSTATQTFTLIGEEGPYYTKSQADTLLNAKQNTLTAGSNVQIVNDTISATDTTYTAGTGLALNGTQFSVDTTTIATQSDLTAGLATKQDTLTAGTNIQINNNTVSATDTTYSDFTGTDGTSAGVAGLVPAPATTDAGKFLKADGTWDTAGGGSGPTVVQTTGTSQTDVMSQNATTSMVFADPATQYKIKIGAGASSSEGSDAIEIGHSAAATKMSTVAIGHNASATGMHAIGIGSSTRAAGAQSCAIGYSANANGTQSCAIGFDAGDGVTQYGVSVGMGAHAKANGAIALGAASGYSGMAVGEMHIGTAETSYGYSSSNYRLLSGLYDGQSAHDAATVGQINATIDAINTALSTSIPHIGA